MGTEDTTKAAGHKLSDVKTDHFTIETDHGRQTMTTGFTENTSNFGEDSAVAYNYKLKCFYILAECTVEEIMENIDFFYDRPSR